MAEDNEKLKITMLDEKNYQILAMKSEQDAQGKGVMENFEG